MDCVPIGGGGVDATDDGKETIPVPFAGALFGAPEPLNATLDAGRGPGSRDGWIAATFATSAGGVGGVGGAANGASPSDGMAFGGMMGGEGMTRPDFTGEAGEGMTPPDFTGEEGEMPTPPNFTGEDGEMNAWS